MIRLNSIRQIYAVVKALISKLAVPKLRVSIT